MSHPMYHRVALKSVYLRRRWRLCGKKEAVDLSSTQMLATGMTQREVMRKYLLGSEFV